MAAEASFEATREVQIPTDHIPIHGNLAIPRAAKGIVLFAHGSGSGRFSPRNNFVAEVLQRAGLATLLMDLLSEAEAQDRRLVFDIDLLASRLLDATRWLKDDPDVAPLRPAYFGASAGAAAALQAAAREGDTIAAVVSRGGRPDLALPFLSQVRAPTLLIVGGDDVPVLALNREALTHMTCPRELIVVPGASHLFEEPGTLEQVADLARDWFLRHLA